MAKSNPLIPVDSVKVTIVVDNYIDVFLPGGGPVTRMGLKAEEPLLAEHGLSILLEVTRGHGKRLVLVDTAYSSAALLHNMRILGYNPLQFDTVVISHGHPDHYGGLIGLLEQRKAPVNVVLHPNALLSRYAVSPGGDLNGPYLLDKEKVERSGGRLILCENHMMVTDGVLVTGEVSRGCSPEWPGKAERKILKNGIWENDEFSDDQAVVVNLKGKGLVVIGGCMHAGIINTMEHVKKVSGIDRIHAIIGGFHLTGAPEENTITAIENLKKVNPALLIGGHCTGLNTIFKMMQMMPEQFRISCSGTIIDLKA